MRGDLVIARIVQRFMSGPLASPAREAAKSAAHALEARGALAWDADLAVKHSQAVGNLLASLTQTRDAVVHIGPFLIVKSNWTVAVHQLTLAQQFDLEHMPVAGLAGDEILATLGLAAAMQPAQAATGAGLPAA
jgi:hypothetical protein